MRCSVRRCSCPADFYSVRGNIYVVFCSNHGWRYAKAGLGELHPLKGTKYEQPDGASET